MAKVNKIKAYSLKKYIFIEGGGISYPEDSLRSVHCWISFTVVTNLALSASGVGMESCPDSPEERTVLHPILYTTFYNLNILLMALHEHPTLCFSLRLLLLGLYYHLSSYTIAICMYICFGHGIVIRQQFHLNKGYTSPTALRPAEYARYT